MEKIYYISQGDTLEEHLLNIEKMCLSGIRLIQLRLKNISDDTYLDIAKKTVSICHYFGAKIIINDNVWVAEKSKADGVHLGKKDISPLEAAKRFSGLIGGTANSYEDCQSLIDMGVDYIGLGPLRYTETKKNLSPILNIDRICSICKKIKNKEIPIYAIGGIREADIDKLSYCAVHGVAISGMLTNMKEKEIVNFLDRLRK